MFTDLVLLSPEDFLSSVKVATLRQTISKGPSTSNTLSHLLSVPETAVGNRKMGNKTTCFTVTLSWNEEFQHLTEMYFTHYPIEPVFVFHMHST
jgi:hypothetical protein